SLLDELFKEDGQTLGSLERHLPMTRFGVMKHLKVLERAGLVTTRRRGREKLHYLNAVPIRLVHDRWVSKYAEPWAAMLTGLKARIEEQTMEKVFEIYIKTTPERLWQAITDGEMRSKYSFGVGISSDWTPGSSYEAVHPGALPREGHPDPPCGRTPWRAHPERHTLTGAGRQAGGGTLKGTSKQAGVAISRGENLEVEPPLRLVQSFDALWGEDVRAEATSRVTWEIEPVGDSCRLTVTHDQLREGANEELFGGWPMILSGLKTLLETGELLTTPGSLMYSATAPPA
ncbi:MAG TPA: SRPBCC domain-containing protein, partial [Solirubrobacteraceae bacterium]|nr:SRPBCC domain-containing protein [Solirubrobacteraceae bacterium]